MSLFHVAQIKAYLIAEYRSRLWKNDLTDENNLSRILAYYAARLTLDSAGSSELVNIEITDGGADRGIDAVGLDLSSKSIVFVQSKWKQNGTGSMEITEVLRFLDGVKSLLGMKCENHLMEASTHMREAIQSAVSTPGTKIYLVTATTAKDPLGERVLEPVHELLGEFNDLDNAEPLAYHKHLLQSDFFNSLIQSRRPTINLCTQIQDWGYIKGPPRAFFGRVSANQVAEWFREYGVDLFARNIRVTIPRSDINAGIAATLREDPELLVYYNNGITVLCGSIGIAPTNMANREAGVFNLNAASIVNGAQTVSTIGSLLGGESEDNLGRAFVMVRCIEIPGNDDEFGRNITRYANTQNVILTQDFAFLDPEQHRLARELSVLSCQYILRSFEAATEKPGQRVITLRSAAIGLACACSDISFAVVAKREVSRLFSDTSMYKALFNPSTEASRIFRSVKIYQEILWWLDVVARNPDYQGLFSGVAIHGRLVVCHRIMRRLGDSFLDGKDGDLDETLKTLPSSIRSELDGILGVFPENSYPGNVFKNKERVLELLSHLDG
jgi:hypothetical protein